MSMAMSRWFVLCLLVVMTTLPTPSTPSHRARRTIALLARGLANYLGINQPVRQGADPVEPLTYPPPIVGGDPKPKPKPRTTTTTTTTTSTTTPAVPDLSAIRAALRGLTTPPSTRFPPRRPRVQQPEFLPLASPTDNGDPDKKVVLIGIPVALHHIQRLRGETPTDAAVEQDAVDAEAKRQTQSQNLYKAFSSLLRQVPTRPAKPKEKEAVKEVVNETTKRPEDMSVEEMMKAMQGYEDNYERYRERIATKLRMVQRPGRPVDSYGDVVASVHAEEESVGDMVAAMKALEDSYEQYRARVGEKLRSGARPSTGRPIDSYGNIVPLVKPSKGPPKKAIQPARQAVEDRPLAWTFVAKTTTPTPPTTTTPKTKQSTLSWMFFGDQSNTATPKKQSMLSWMFFGEPDATTTTTATPTAHADPEVYTNYLDSQMGVEAARPAPTPDFFDAAGPGGDFFAGHDAAYIDHLAHHHRPESGVVADFHPSAYGRPQFQPLTAHPMASPMGHHFTQGATGSYRASGPNAALQTPFNVLYNRDSSTAKGGAFAGNGTATFGAWSSPVALAGAAAAAVDHRGEDGVRQGGAPVYDFASSGVSVARVLPSGEAPRRRRINRV